jgi:hypothetical protein
MGQKGDHDLGRSYLDPNNVGASGGNLKVELPANSLNGGEIKVPRALRLRFLHGPHKAP